MLSQQMLLKMVILSLSLFLISCQPPVSPPTPVAQENDIQDIHVQMAEPVKTTADVEQFPLPNCGGTDKLGQSLGMYASITKNVTVGGKATVTGGGEVAIPETAKLKLEIQVELAYQQAYESANSRLDSIEMSAAAGTHVVYTIVWEEQVFSSIVQYSADSQVYEAPYTYKLRIPKIDKSYNVECSNTPTSEVQAINIPTPPILSPTSLPSVQSVQKIFKNTLLYEDTFDSSTGWNVEEGMKIENGNLIIYPRYDAVPKNPAIYADFVFESRFYIQDSGSMAFYLHHQPCTDWNCSIQIALYFGNENTVAARRFLGATQGKQFDIMKGSIDSVIRPNDWNTIAIGAKGNTYEVVLNDDFVLNFTDETYTSGAFIIDDAGPKEVKIDYVRIYDVQ